MYIFLAISRDIHELRFTCSSNQHSLMHNAHLRLLGWPRRALKSPHQPCQPRQYTLHRNNQTQTRQLNRLMQAFSAHAIPPQTAMSFSLLVSATQHAPHHLIHAAPTNQGAQSSEPQPNGQSTLTSRRQPTSPASAQLSCKTFPIRQIPCRRASAVVGEWATPLTFGARDFKLDDVKFEPALTHVVLFWLFSPTMAPRALWCSTQ